MTPLQKAAQAVIRHWDKSIDPTDAMSELRKALEAPPAQAVEPVATVQCVRGVTFGYLDVMQPVGTKLYTHPAPPVGTKLYTHPAPPVEQAQAVKPATGRRAELIAELRAMPNNWSSGSDDVTTLCAADMLESDAQAMSNLLARIHRDDGHYESEHGQIKAVGDADLIVAKLNALSDAQQVAVPMTEAQIFECDPVPHVMFDQQRIDFARAIEAHCKPKAQGAKPVAQQVAAPDGWVLVPIEPTPAILDAMSSSGWKTASYKAMLAAAQGAKP